MKICRWLRRSKICLKKTERKFFRLGKNIFEVKDGETVEVSMEDFFDYVNETMDNFSKTSTAIYTILFGIWGTIIAALIVAIVSVLK